MTQKHTPFRSRVAALLAALVAVFLAGCGQQATGGERDSPSAEAAAGGQQDGELFAHIGLDNALSQAKAEGKWVVIDFMAEWCGPCKLLERTTWKDEQVIELVRSKAVPVAIDVDEERDLAVKYKIQAMPTIVVLDSSGREIHRFIGYKDAPRFLSEFRSIDA